MGPHLCESHLELSSNGKQKLRLTVTYFLHLFLITHNLSILDIRSNFLAVILTCWWLPPAGYHPRVCQVISFVRSARCFLFSLLYMFMVLNVFAASQFGCVAILDSYFSAYLLICSLTVGIPRYLRMSSFLTYHGGHIFKRDIAKFLHYYIVCIAIRNCKRKCTIR